MVISPLTSYKDNCITCFNHYLNLDNTIKDRTIIQNTIKLLLKGIEVISIKHTKDYKIEDKFIILWLTFDGLIYYNIDKTESENKMHLSRLYSKVDTTTKDCVILYNDEDLWIKIRLNTETAANLFSCYFNKLVIIFIQYMKKNGYMSDQLSQPKWSYIESL